MSVPEKPGGPLELLQVWLKRIVDVAAPVILDSTYYVHEGSAFCAGGLSTGILDGGQIAVAFWNPSGTIGSDAHVSAIKMSVGGQSFGILYEGGEIQATGTFVEPHNRYRREAADKPSQWKVGFMPVINSLGTRLRHKFIGGSAAANPNAGRDDGQTAAGLGWILNSENLYIMVILNTSGATIPGHIDLEWHEHHG